MAQSLDLSATAVGDQGVWELFAGCRALEALALRDCPNVSDKAIEAIAESLKSVRRLRRLDLARSRCFSNEALLAMLEHGGGVLHVLSLRGCTQVDRRSRRARGARRGRGGGGWRRRDGGGAAASLASLLGLIGLRRTVTA